eukprot:32092-Pelagomonas_calceolata.AAC.2
MQSSASFLVPKHWGRCTWVALAKVSCLFCVWRMSSATNSVYMLYIITHKDVELANPSHGRMRTNALGQAALPHRIFTCHREGSAHLPLLVYITHLIRMPCTVVCHSSSAAAVTSGFHSSRACMHVCVPSCGERKGSAQWCATAQAQMPSHQGSIAPRPEHVEEHLHTCAFICLYENVRKHGERSLVLKQRTV